MARVDRLKTVFVDEIPEILQDGILYVSEECCVALHNCMWVWGRSVDASRAHRISTDDGRRCSIDLAFDRQSRLRLRFTLCDQAGQDPGQAECLAVQSRRTGA
jgi:hypothetical protein